MGTSTWAWHTVMDPLGKHFSCYAFDMLGHGKSDKPTTGFSMPDFARSLDHAMQVMNIHRAHIVGNSVGAVLAVELAASYPDRVDKLVLVGCPVWDPRTAAQRIAEGASNYDRDDMPRPRTPEELGPPGTFADPRPEWVEKTNELRAQAGVWGCRRTTECLAWYDVVSRLPLVKASATLVLNGEHDRLRETDEVLLNNLPNATKQVLPGVGHLPQIEDPEGFVSAVLDFLK